MTPKLVRYDAPGWGVGEVWLEGQRVVWSELPRPSAELSRPSAELQRPSAELPRPSAELQRPSAELPRPSAELQRPSAEAARGRSDLARRLAAFFAGRADDFADVELELEDGFYGDCARALRRVPRGDVVTYGELAALAGYPGAARAAGTFCARNHLAPFLPVHRVVAAAGIGRFGSLGVDYKRRMLALEDVAL